MSEASIRAGIKSVLNTVADIGAVHDYERYPTNNDWSAFLTLFKATIGGVDQVRGWTLSRRSSSDSMNNPVPHAYIIRGMMSFKDSTETEKTFTTLIESVRTAFRADKTLSGNALGHDFIQVSLQEPRFFGGVLCHYCELSITAYEHVY